MDILIASRPYEGTIQDIQKFEKTFPNIRIKGDDDSETICEDINSVIEYRLYLVFDYLENTTIKSTVRGVDEAVLLPATVDEAYEKILSRSTKPNETRTAILILLAAYRPLTLREMQIELGLTLDTPYLEPDKAFKLRLREWYGLFVTVHDEKTYFLHQTAREFLPLSLRPCRVQLLQYGRIRSAFA
ncbi:hypothetical protein B0T24DRAFT_676719 [Lasiosphaeria ovina]|uniref:Uncharacterized protein n=1 Tax=Lasiosphaeria ovina TaxID=92902 RepID=A0AAE0KH03_9PEZI|nr:hypothetical protein B0T24DRAFT_676719 [Lasiosphaeria ovina]